MPDLLTPNFGWTLPTVGAASATWGVSNNANWSSLDATLHTGLLAVSSLTTVITAPNMLVLNSGAPPNQNIILGKRNNLNRWGIIMPDAETGTGTNPGDNFIIQSYADDGSVLTNPLEIIRSTGQVVVTGGGLAVGTGALLSSVPVTFGSTLGVSGVASLAGGMGFPSYYPGHVIQLGWDGANLRAKVDALDIGPLQTGSSGIIGEVLMFAGSAPPANYKLCDGTVYPNTAIPLLAPILNNKFGGVVGTSNAVPNMQFAFPIGVGTGAGGTVALGGTGGEATHVLTSGEMPSHNHTLTDPGHVHTVTDPQHRHTIGTQVYGLGSGGNNITAFSGPGGTGISDNASTGISIQSHTTGVTIAAAGSGAAHNTMPPFVGLNFIIKFQ